MLVGFSKGGSTIQNYAVTGQYADRVTTVITFGSPLVKNANQYGSFVDVLHIEAKIDPIPQDDFVGGVYDFRNRKNPSEQSWRPETSTTQPIGNNLHGRHRKNGYENYDKTQKASLQELYGTTSITTENGPTTAPNYYVA